MGNNSNWIFQLILTLMLVFFLVTGFKLFEDALKRLICLDVSFKFQWQHRILTIPMYLLLMKNSNMFQVILTLMLVFFLVTGLELFEDDLKRLIGLDVSFKLKWQHRILTIPMYLLLLSFFFYPIDTVKFLISVLSKILIK